MQFVSAQDFYNSSAISINTSSIFKYANNQVVPIERLFFAISTKCLWNHTQLILKYLKEILIYRLCNIIKLINQYKHSKSNRFPSFAYADTRKQTKMSSDS